MIERGGEGGKQPELGLVTKIVEQMKGMNSTVGSGPTYDKDMCRRAGLSRGEYIAGSRKKKKKKKIEKDVDRERCR